jgi:hypothetical protein
MEQVAPIPRDEDAERMSKAVRQGRIKSNLDTRVDTQVREMYDKKVADEVFQRAYNAGAAHNALMASQGRPREGLQDAMDRYGVGEQGVHAGLQVEDPQGFMDRVMMSVLGSCLDPARRDDLNRTRLLRKARNAAVKGMPPALEDEAYKETQLIVAEKALQDAGLKYSMLRKALRQGKRVLPRIMKAATEEVAVCLRAQRQCEISHQHARSLRKWMESNLDRLDEHKPNEVLTTVVSEIDDALRYLPSKNMSKDEDRMDDLRDRYEEMRVSSEEGRLLMGDFFENDDQAQLDGLEAEFEDLLLELEQPDEDEERGFQALEASLPGPPPGGDDPSDDGDDPPHGGEEGVLLDMHERTPVAIQTKALLE